MSYANRVSLSILMILSIATTAMAQEFTQDWSFAVVGGPQGTAVDSLGNIYTATDAGRLYSISAAGSQNWSYDLGSNNFASVASVGPGGKIYASVGNGYSATGSVHAFALDGTHLWSSDLGGVGKATLAIGRDGTIYVGSVYTGGVGVNENNKLYALNPDGSKKWDYTTLSGEGIGSIAIMSSGDIVFTAGTKIYCLNPSGQLRWTDTPGGTDLALDESDNVYVSGPTGLRKLSNAGTTLWEYGIGAGYGPAIGADGTVYGSSGNKLYAVNPDGSEKWTYDCGLMARAPAVGANGVIYFATGQDGATNYLFAISSTGQLLDQTTILSTAALEHRSSPCLTDSGKLYIGTLGQDYVQAFHVSAGGLADSPWPKVYHDNGNTASSDLIMNGSSDLVVTIPDTVASYASTIRVPVRITNTSGLGVVASELSVASRKDIVLSAVTDLTTTENTITKNSLVYQGWSVEENMFIGSSAMDTLAIAMSTAQDTLQGEGDLIYLTLQTADIRHPDSTALQIVHALFNDGTPSAALIHGSLKLIGADGIITATPDTIVPRDSIAISVTDIDADLDVGTPDQVSATVTSAIYGDTQILPLTETGNSTGIFTGSVPTQFALVTGPSNDGVITTIAGDSILATFVDSLSATGTTVTRSDVVKVIGGVDGLVQTSYVVQALDQSSPHPVIRDTVRVQINDADLDLDVGLAEQVSATITNAASNEVETVTLTETDVNTGVFQIRVPTIAGSSGINNDGVLSLVSWSELEISYADSLTAQGSIDPTLDTTQVVSLFGDADLNDKVQAFDAARLLAISVGLVSANTQTTLVGDVDGSDDILAIDVSFVLQYVVRLIDRFPVQTDIDITLPNDPKNHPFLKPVPLDQVIALGDLQSQEDGTYLLPITLSEREGILSGTFTLGVDSNIEVVGVIATPEYGKFMTAFNTADEGLKIAFAGSKSDLTGSGDVLLLKLRATDGIPIRLSLDQVYLNGQSLTPTVNIEAIEVVEAKDDPLVTQLYQNVPNPFNPQTNIRYDLAKAGQVNVVIYSITGQRIRTLVSEFQDAGSYQLTWDGADALGHQVSTGIYLVRMISNSFVQTQKMLLLR